MDEREAVEYPEHAVESCREVGDGGELLHRPFLDYLHECGAVDVAVAIRSDLVSSNAHKIGRKKTEEKQFEGKGYQSLQRGEEQTTGDDIACDPKKKVYSTRIKRCKLLEILPRSFPKIEKEKINEISVGQKKKKKEKFERAKLIFPSREKGEQSIALVLDSTDVYL